MKALGILLGALIVAVSIAALLLIIGFTPHTLDTP